MLTTTAVPWAAQLSPHSSEDDRNVVMFDPAGPVRYMPVTPVSLRMTPGAVVPLTEMLAGASSHSGCVGVDFSG